MRMCRALLLVAALPLGACGTSSADDPLDRAIAKSASPDSYRFEILTKFKSGGRTIVARGHGAGYRDGVTFTVRLPLGRGASSPTSRIVDERNGRLIEYVTDPATELGRHKRWMKFDRGAQLRKRGLSPDDVGGADFRNPARFLAALDKARAEIRRVAKTSVGGIETTHYRARLSPRDLVHAAPAAKRKAAAAAVGDAGAIESDFWVTGNGTMRRLRQEIGGTVTTITFHDWGAPFTLHVPPPQDISITEP